MGKDSVLVPRAGVAPALIPESVGAFPGPKEFFLLWDHLSCCLPQELFEVVLIGEISVSLEIICKVMPPTFW